MSLEPASVLLRAYCRRRDKTTLVTSWRRDIQVHRLSRRVVYAVRSLMSGTPYGPGCDNPGTVGTIYIRLYNTEHIQNGDEDLFAVRDVSSPREGRERTRGL